MINIFINFFSFLLLNLLFNLLTINETPPDHQLTINETPPDHHLQVIINAKLCLDIERNPGPIHQRCFDAAQRFCEDQTPTNLKLLKNSVSKTLITQEAFPETFLSDDKVIIWRNVLNILDHNNFDNSELKKEIFSLHDSWEDSLIKKESPRQNESPHCKCDLHGTSCPSMTDSHHMHGTPIAPVNERALPPQTFQIIQNASTTETETNGMLKITDEANRVCAQPFTSHPVEALSPQPLALSLQPNSPFRHQISNVVIDEESIESFNTNTIILNAVSLDIEGTTNEMSNSLNDAQPSTAPSLIVPQLLESIIKEEYIEILNTNNKSMNKFFSYGRLSGTKPCKFVCRTACDMKKTQNKVLVKDQGVIRETLINHARLFHKIKPDFQKKKAFVVDPLQCATCNKIYTKKQELKKHMGNKHPTVSSNSPGANPSTTHQGPEPSTNVISDPSNHTDHEEQYNSSFPQFNITSTPTITHLIPSSPLHEIKTVSRQALSSIFGTYQSASVRELPDNLNNTDNQMLTDEEISNYDVLFDALS